MGFTYCGFVEEITQKYLKLALKDYFEYNKHTYLTFDFVKNYEEFRREILEKLGSFVFKKCLTSLPLSFELLMELKIKDIPTCSGYQNQIFSRYLRL